MELQTQRLKLIPCTENTVSTISGDEFKIGPHIEFHISELKNDPTLYGWGVWLVIDKFDNKVIGDIGFKGKPNAENAVEVGYGIVPSAQNNGFATEAVRAIIDWAFSHEEVNKIIAECLDDNTPSIKVLQKLNMKHIGNVDNMMKWELIR